jgi:rod shape-determining protein MreB
MNPLNYFDNREIGIDLGTANILVAVKHKGIVLREPSVVAYNKENGELIAYGNKAKQMLGKTPENIQAIKPLKDGVIADLTAATVMLKAIMQKVCKKYHIVRPSVVVGVPSLISEVEKRAVQSAIMSSGAGEVFLIDEPMAAAIGSGLNIAEPVANFIVDIGGGTTEVAVISLGGIVCKESIKVAGDKLTQDIIRYAKRHLDLIIGENMAEMAKIKLACAIKYEPQDYFEIKGRDVYTGLPSIRTITSDDVCKAIHSNLLKIVDAIKTCIENTPPELLSDLAVKGIMIAGGGALIKDLDVFIYNKTDTHVLIAEDALDCVVKGTCRILENENQLRKLFESKRV